MEKGIYELSRQNHETRQVRLHSVVDHFVLVDCHLKVLFQLGSNVSARLAVQRV